MNLRRSYMYTEGKTKRKKKKKQKKTKKQTNQMWIAACFLIIILNQIPNYVQ